MRFAARLVVFAPLASAAWLAPATAHAGDCDADPWLSTCIDADNVWASALPHRLVTVSAGPLPQPSEIAVGLFASFLSKPVRIRVASPDPDGTSLAITDDVVNTTVAGALGVHRLVAVTMALPMTLYETGSGVGVLTGEESPLPRSAVRDPRVGALVTLLEPPSGATSASGAAIGGTASDDGLRVTGRLDVAVPLGDEDAFASSNSLVVSPGVAAEHRIGRLTIGGEVGARLRGTSSFAGARVGSQLSAAAGAMADVLSRERLSIGLEAFSLLGLVEQRELVLDPATGARTDRASDRRLLPTEWMLTARSSPLPSGDVTFGLGGGTAISITPESALTSPRYRFTLSARYMQQHRDGDGDGVRDGDDRCPELAEDLDGHDDADGCPDDDNDSDGVPDGRDRCRGAAETVDNFEDGDGCPDLDDDRDGLPDDVDRCRNDAEDRDGFEDADGCPEPGPRPEPPPAEPPPAAPPTSLPEPAP